MVITHTHICPGTPIRYSPCQILFFPPWQRLPFSSLPRIRAKRFSVTCPLMCPSNVSFAALLQEGILTAVRPSVLPPSMTLKNALSRRVPFPPCISPSFSPRTQTALGQGCQRGILSCLWLSLKPGRTSSSIPTSGDFTSFVTASRSPATCFGPTSAGYTPQRYPSSFLIRA